MAEPILKTKFNRTYVKYNPEDTEGPSTSILGTVVQAAEQQDDDNNNP